MPFFRPGDDPGSSFPDLLRRVGLGPGALPEGFRRRRLRRPAGRVAVLRKPEAERERSWDDYQGFDA